MENDLEMYDGAGQIVSQEKTAEAVKWFSEMWAMRCSIAAHETMSSPIRKSKIDSDESQLAAVVFIDGGVTLEGRTHPRCACRELVGVRVGMEMRQRRGRNRRV